MATVLRQLLSGVLALCVVASVCNAKSRHTRKADRRKPAPAPSTRTTPASPPPSGYNPTAERSKFFAAAGPDSELTDKEFALDRAKGTGFVRRTDSWSYMLRYDKDGSKTIDWFEADACRRSLGRTTGGKGGYHSPSKVAPAPKPTAGYNPAAARVRFFAAAGQDSELSEKEFSADRARAEGFVRKKDSWLSMLRYDKDGNKTIDWFEANAYRISKPLPPAPPPASSRKVPPSTPSTPASAGKDVAFGGHHYRVIRKRISWDDAAKECEALGGHLVTIEAEDEFDFLKKLAGVSRLWVGATDLGKEGHWVWVSGQPLPQGRELWSPGEPNGGTSCNYASIMARGLYDSTSPYGSVSGMICEFDK